MEHLDGTFSGNPGTNRRLATSLRVPSNDLVNQRLRTVMLRQGVSRNDLAKACGVDPKTVDRWITLGRLPHSQHRWNAARRLDTDETYIWPQIMELDRGRRLDAAQAELIKLYPDRASVPRETWIQLLKDARHRVDVLVFAGTFMPNTNPRVAKNLIDRATNGVQIRLCFGDPKAEAVRIRDDEERLHGTLGPKIAASLTYYRELVDTERCQIRLHAANLYASLFRYDNNLLVNPHIWGSPASANPTLHLRRVDGGELFDRYMDSFDAVWDSSNPWRPEES